MRRSLRVVEALSWGLYGERVAPLSIDACMEARSLYADA